MRLGCARHKGYFFVGQTLSSSGTMEGGEDGCVNHVVDGSPASTQSTYCVFLRRCVCVPSAVVLPPGEHILEILFALTARTPSTSPTTTTFCRLQPRVCPLYSLWRVLLSLPSFLIVACLFSALRLRHTHTNIDNIDGAGRAHLIIETF